VNAAVEFDVPARAEYVGLLRVLVSSLAAERRDLDDERLDDLRLALSEACSLSVDADAATERRLTVACREEDDAFVLDVSGGGPGSWAEVVGLQLIRALVDDVSAVNVGGEDLLRLRLLCPPAPPYQD